MKIFHSLMTAIIVAFAIWGYVQVLDIFPYDGTFVSGIPMLIWLWISIFGVFGYPEWAFKEKPRD